MLLHGLALQSYCLDDSEFDGFQRKVRNLRDEIAHIGGEDAAVPAAAAAPGDGETGALPQAAHRQSALETAIAAVSESLLALARATDSQAHALRQSEHELMTATQGDELAGAAARLSVCLDGIRNQILRKSDTLLMPSQHYSACDVDSATGLPDARQAMDALAEAWKHRRSYCAAIFGVRRLNAINARFGYQAGDDVLRSVTQHLAEYFAREYLLFRWRGPCVLCIMEKKMPLPLIAAEVRRVASMRLEQTMTMKSRDAIVAISLSCSLISLEADSFEQVIARLEEFLNSQILER